MDKPLLRLGEAVEDLRRAYSAVVTEIEIAIDTAKNLRKEIAEGREREKELRALLRDAGLASYNDEPKGSNHVSNTPENR
jgi:hypothetical protein